ncbi:MAG: M23 family metallopeptidase, partial [bacterium]|nr:M23 family metallopeptidase [bacterium]
MIASAREGLSLVRVSLVSVFLVSAALTSVPGSAFGSDGPDAAGPSSFAAPLGVSQESAQPDWQLPFEAGQSWKAGSRHNTNALDFGPTASGNKRVVAVAPGTVGEIRCDGGSYLTVAHSGGWKSGYYHLTNTQTELIGKWVEAGTYLGDAAQTLPCGGTSTFDHVHLTIWQNGQKYNVDGLTIGGFTQHAGSAAYHGTWTNSRGRTVVTNTGNAACCLTSTTSPAVPSDRSEFVEAADVNGDGLDDVVLRYFWANRTSVIRVVLGQEYEDRWMEGFNAEG